MAYKCQDALHRRTRTRAAYASADADADGCDFALEAFPYADAPLRHLRIRVWRWSSPSPIAGAHLLASSFPYPAAARCLLAWLLLLAPSWLPCLAASGLWAVGAPAPSLPSLPFARA